MCLLLGYVNIFLLFFVVTLGFKVDTLLLWLAKYLKHLKKEKISHV